MSDATRENDSVNSIPWTCKYTLTTFLDFRQNNPSASSLLLNTHFTGTGFLHLDFTTLLFVGIQAFLDRKIITSDIADIFHRFSFGLVIASLRVSDSTASVEKDVLIAHYISSSSLSTIGITLVSPLTLQMPAMNGFCILVIVGLYNVSSFFSTFNTIS